MKIYGCEYEPLTIGRKRVTLVNVVTGTRLVMPREEYQDRLTW